MLLKSKRSFRRYDVIPDWVMVIETLLQWEMWLKSDKMTLFHVQRSRKKHQYIMQLMLKVCRRTKGMGMNTTKFHGILHMTDDILAYGVPLEYDTGSKEQHHSVNKTAAKLTQKNKAKFEEQVHHRCEEVELLGLAGAEMDGDALFDYYNWSYTIGQGQNNLHQGQMTSESDDLSIERSAEQPVNTRIDGKHFGVKTLNDGTNVMFCMAKVNGKYPVIPCEQDFIDFCVGLQHVTAEHCGNLAIKSRYTRDGVIFRADFNFRGSFWRDWVVVDWGPDYGELPNKLWGFVDLSELPAGNNGISYGGLGSVGPGVYAIVESSKACTNPDRVGSELLTPIMLEVAAMSRGYVTEMRYYLAEVEAFVGPAVVVPDIGGPNNSFFWLRSRDQWAKLFETWLSQPLELLPREDYEPDLGVNDSESDENDSESDDSEQ